MRLSDVIMAKQTQLLVVLADGSQWFIGDIGYHSTPDGGIACYTDKPITLLPPEGGEPRRVGESEIMGIAPAEPVEESPPVTGFAKLDWLPKEHVAKAPPPRMPIAIRDAREQSERNGWLTSAPPPA